MKRQKKYEQAQSEIKDLTLRNKKFAKNALEMSFMKYEIRRELKIVPAKVSVVEHKKSSLCVQKLR